MITHEPNVWMPWCMSIFNSFSYWHRLRVLCKLKVRHSFKVPIWATFMMTNFPKKLSQSHHIIWDTMRSCTRFKVAFLMRLCHKWPIWELFCGINKIFSYYAGNKRKNPCVFELDNLLMIINYLIGKKFPGFSC